VSPSWRHSVIRHLCERAKYQTAFDPHGDGETTHIVAQQSAAVSLLLANNAEGEHEVRWYSRHKREIILQETGKWA